MPDGRQGFVLAKCMAEKKKFVQRSQRRLKTLSRPQSCFLAISASGEALRPRDLIALVLRPVYLNNRITLLRDTNMQVVVGNSVVIEEPFKYLEADDLVFWGTDINHIYHVGIYPGNKQFIHSDGMVRINSFNPNDGNYSEYRRRSLQAVRRILK